MALFSFTAHSRKGAYGLGFRPVPRDENSRRLSMLWRTLSEKSSRGWGCPTSTETSGDGDTPATTSAPALPVGVPVGVLEDVLEAPETSASPPSGTGAIDTLRTSEPGLRAIRSLGSKGGDDTSAPPPSRTSCCGMWLGAACTPRFHPVLSDSRRDVGPGAVLRSWSSRCCFVGGECCGGRPASSWTRRSLRPLCPATPLRDRDAELPWRWRRWALWWRWWRRPWLP